MTYEDVTKKISAAITEYQNEIIALGHDLWKCPETGYKEHKTQARCIEEIEKLGLTVTTYEGTTGFTADFETGNPGPVVMIMGELDSVVCFEHPDCDPETGAVHACGHHAQIASTIGAAYGLIKSGVLGSLAGTIRLLGVPSEEFLEIDWRNTERLKGNISFLGGKAEFLKRGVFDDVAVVIGMHSTGNPEKSLVLRGTGNGFVGKSVFFKGRSAHAAGMPEDGINALYAANVALSAFNAVRETFQDKDTVRVHPIITKGGDIVNAIPEDVRVEVLVRAATMDAVLDASRKFDRAMGAGAYALGATAQIETMPGYLPYVPNALLDEIQTEVALPLLPDPSRLSRRGHGTGSSDVGDLCSVLPTVQISIGLCEGGAHSKDFRVVSDEHFTFSSEYLAHLAAKLLYGDGSLAQRVKDEYQPMFKSPAAYCEFAEKLYSTVTLP